MMWSSRLSLVTFFMMLSCLVVFCEEESCSKDGTDCGEKKKSLMLEPEIEAYDNKNEDSERIIDESLNMSSESATDDDTEEVDGIFEPCIKSGKGGQLHRLMVEKAGYQLTE